MAAPPPAPVNIAPINAVRPGIGIHPNPNIGLVILRGESWKAAAWHHDVVRVLDINHYGPHLYAHPPASDPTDQADKTTFLTSQGLWDFNNPANRPQVLYDLRAPDDHINTAAVPDLVYVSGGRVRIVVDIVTQEPLRAFPDLPLQISRKVEGGRVEAITRLDSRIRMQEFLQRMLPSIDQNGFPHLNGQGKFANKRPTERSLASVVTNYRAQHRCLPWRVTHAKSSVFDTRLRADLTDVDRAANSTRRLPDLSEEEMKAMRGAAKVNTPARNARLRLVVQPPVTSAPTIAPASAPLPPTAAPPPVLPATSLVAAAPAPAPGPAFTPHFNGVGAVIPYGTQFAAPPMQKDRQPDPTSSSEAMTPADDQTSQYDTDATESELEDAIIDPVLLAQDALQVMASSSSAGHTVASATTQAPDEAENDFEFEDEFE